MRAFAHAFAQATQRAAPPPFIISAPAPEPAPQPTVPVTPAPFPQATAPVAPVPLPQATIPVAPAAFPQATRPDTPAGNSILAAPTQISNPLPEPIHNAPTKINVSLPETIPVIQQTQQMGVPGPAAPTQIEPGQHTQATEKPGGPPSGSVPAAKLPKPEAGSARRRLPRGRRRIFALAALVVLPLLLGGLGYFALFGVTLKETYTITTVQGATNVSKQQVNDRSISIELEYATQAAPATGGPAPAIQAHGILHLTSNFQTPVSLQAGMVLDNNNTVGSGCTAPIEMVLDASITLPAAPAGTLDGTGVQADVPAHVLQFGTIGNIPNPPDTRCFRHVEGSPGSYWFAGNYTPFTGGRDAILQQSDIDRATNSLLAANQTPDPRQEMKALLDANERWLDTPAPSCQPDVSSDHAVGDRIGEALVILSYLCTGYKYDHDGALQVAASLLTGRAARDLISFFRLNGKIAATVTSATLTNPQQATIRLIVAAQGAWVLRL